MKRFLSIVRVCLRFIWRLLLGAACAALAVLLYLSFFQAPLPDRMVRAALEKWTPPGAGFTVDRKSVV